MPKCKICSKIIYGRTDKKFCSLKCKNYYHTNLRRVTELEVKQIDTILHRNRSILLEILGKTKKQVKIDRIILDKKKSNFKYHTHTTINSVGKTYVYVYDFAYMSFSDNEILIVRR
jgi:predicted nucleic acid-binding Zn ribbon protein